MADVVKFEIQVDASSGQATLKQFGQQVQQTASQASQGASQMGSAFSSLGGSISGMGAAVKSAVVAFGGIFAAAKVVQFLKDSALAAGDFTKQMSGLGLVLQSVGAPVQQTQQDFLNLAIAVEKATGSLRQDSVAALQRFIGLTNDAAKAQTAFKLAVNISEGSGKDLAASVDLVANLLAGKAAKSAGEFGIAIKNSNGEMKTGVEVLGELQTRYGNAADTIEDGNADVDAATAAWNSMKLSVGELLKQMAPVGTAIANIVKGFQVFIALVVGGFTKVIGYATALAQSFVALWHLMTGDDPEAAIKEFANINQMLDEMNSKVSNDLEKAWEATFGEALPVALGVTKDAVKDLADVVPVDPKVAAAAKAAADEFDRMTGSTKALTDESTKLKAAYDKVIEDFNKGLISLEKTEYMLTQIVKRQKEISNQTGGLIGGFAPDLLTEGQEKRISALLEKQRSIVEEMIASARELKAADAFGGISVDADAANAFLAQRQAATESIAASMDALIAANERVKATSGTDDEIAAQEAYNQALEHVNKSILDNSDLLLIQKGIVLDVTTLKANAAEEAARQNIADMFTVSNPGEFADAAQAQLDEVTRLQHDALEIRRQQEVANAERIGLETSGINKKYALLNVAIDNQATRDKIALAQAEKKAKEALAFGMVGAFANLGDQIFKNNKATAVANAVMNTYEGATKAISQGGIYGAVMAAVVVAAGMLQVRNIMNTKKGDSGVNSGGGISTPNIPGATAGPASPTEGLRPLEVTLVLQGQGFVQDMDAFTRDLTKSINRAQLQGSSVPLVG